MQWLFMKYCNRHLNRNSWYTFVIVFSEAESEVQRVKLAVMKTEEERHAMERKAGDTELMVHRMVEEAERRQQEAERLRTEVES